MAKSASTTQMQPKSALVRRQNDNDQNVTVASPNSKSTVKSVPVIDGISTGTAVMKQVNDDMKISAVDIFNIIASPSISFLSQDATELSRLILNYGIPKTTEDDVERGGEKGATSVSKIEPIAPIEPEQQLSSTTPGVKKRNMADVIAAKLIAKQESRPKNSNPLNS